MDLKLNKVKNISERGSIKISSLTEFIQTQKDYYSWMIDFECKKAIALERYLIDDAILDEVHHNVKTYIVYDEDVHDIVAYFSIRTTCIIRKLISNIENEKIAKNVMPCIEITKFCLNEQYLSFLEENQYNNKGVGTYIFNMYIVSIIVVLAGMVGFMGVILFAIHDKYEKVINAYRDRMGFETIEDDSTKIISVLSDTSFIVDEYSSECKFMYQDVDEIIKRYEGGYYYA